MAGKRTRRGKPCPVCNAVMHAPEGGGEPVCAFTSSHAGILKARAKAGNQTSETHRKKKR